MESLNNQSRVGFGPIEYIPEGEEIKTLASMRNSGLYSGKALARQSPMQQAGRRSIGGHTPRTHGEDTSAGTSSRTPRSRFSDSMRLSEASSPIQFATNSYFAEEKPRAQTASSVNGQRSQNFNRLNSTSNNNNAEEKAADDWEEYKHTTKARGDLNKSLWFDRAKLSSELNTTGMPNLSMDMVGTDSSISWENLDAEPKRFTKKKMEDSCAHFAEQKHGMRNFEGTVHPVRDPANRQPPRAGYTFTRVPRPHPELYPYDFDETEATQRLGVGYATGHIRNMTPNTKDQFGRSRPATVSGSRHGGGHSANESVSGVAHLHRYDLIRTPKDTRFDSFSVRTDWGRDLQRKQADKKAAKIHREHHAKERASAAREAAEARAALRAFEENLAALAAPAGGGGKKKKQPQQQQQRHHGQQR
mmetsp:Transcript_45255/g.78285  ORF Transcript_45255/g.78285 Transcript_45255/m.78285 type:complete len:417 (+) Transcript_45255:113-1363(+)